MITLELDTDVAGLEVLEAAALRARATELSEMRRLDVQATAYHDRSRSSWVSSEGERAARRWETLNVLLAAIAAAKAHLPHGPAQPGTDAGS